MNVLYIKVSGDNEDKENIDNSIKNNDNYKINNNSKILEFRKIISKFNKVMYKLHKNIKKIFCIVDLEEIFNGYIAKVPLKGKRNIYRENTNKISKSTDTDKNTISKKIINIKKCIIARKIRRIVNEKSIDGIVLADDISENHDFLDKLILKNKFIVNKKENVDSKSSHPFVKERRIFFFDGKGLFKYIIYEILVYIIDIQNRKPELEDIYIVANTIDETMLDNIIFLSTKFKNVNIVSKNIGKYEYIEELVYNNTGNTVILLNNKRKSLRRAKYIINVDNSIDELNEYLIYRKAIILNIENSSIFEKTTANVINLTGFEGIFVNSFKIDLNDKTKQFFEKYGLINVTNMATLYESFLNKRENFWNVRTKIEDAGLIVTKLYGNNGIIDKNEYKRVNINDNDVKKYY